MTISNYLATLGIQFSIILVCFLPAIFLRFLLDDVDPSVRNSCMINHIKGTFVVICASEIGTLIAILDLNLNPHPFYFEKIYWWTAMGWLQTVMMGQFIGLLLLLMASLATRIAKRNRIRPIITFALKGLLPLFGFTFLVCAVLRGMAEWPA